MKTLARIITLFLLLLNLQVSAQPRHPHGPPPPLSKEQREEIETMKIAFLTKRLDLTPEEAKKFWPVYNQFSDEMDKQRQSRMKQHREMREQDNLSEKDYERIVDSEINFRQQELDILRKYNTQYKQILPMKKVAALYRAEEDFKRQLLERMRDRENKKG